MIEKSLLERLYWEEKKTLSEIEEITGLDRCTVWYWMKRYGIPRRTTADVNRGKHLSPRTEFKKGLVPWNKGLTKDIDERVRRYVEKSAETRRGSHHSEEHKQRMREIMKRWARTPEGRADILRASKAAGEANKLHMKKLWANPKYRETTGKKVLGIIHKRLKDPDVVKKRLKALRKKFREDPEFRKEQSQRLRVAYNNAKDVIAKKISEALKGRELSAEHLRAVFKANAVKPNRAEQKLIELIEAHGFPFKYVGDGEVVIHGKCPDFINNNGGKQLIEIYGDYWHRNDDPQERIDLFKRYGFDTLIIWEHELNNETAVVGRINEFMGVV